MRATRGCVHFGSRDGAVFAAFLHLLLNSFVSVDEMFRKSLDVYTHGFVLTDLVPLLGAFSDGNQEVLHPLVVNLEHRQLDFVLLVRVVIGRDSCKNLFAGNRHDTLN